MLKKIKKYQYICRKLRLSIAMLLVACILLSTATFAWLQLSTAPEVSDLQVLAESNDYLQIALATKEHLNALQANGMYDTDGWSNIHDSNTRINNTRWGNQVDLGDDSYGLQYITLRPAILNVEENTIRRSPISTPEYGTDGRIFALNSSSAFGTFNAASGIFDAADASDYGVRVIGRTADSNISALILRKRDTVAAAYDSFYNSFSGLPAEVYLFQLDEASDYTLEKVRTISTQLTDLEDAFEDLVDLINTSFSGSLSDYDQEAYENIINIFHASKEAINNIEAAYATEAGAAPGDTAVAKGEIQSILDPFFVAPSFSYSTRIYDENRESYRWGSFTITDYYGQLEDIYEYGFINGSFGYTDLYTNLEHYVGASLRTSENRVTVSDGTHDLSFSFSVAAYTYSNIHNNPGRAEDIAHSASSAVFSDSYMAVQNYNSSYNSYISELNSLMQQDYDEVLRLASIHADNVAAGRTDSYSSSDWIGKCDWIGREGTGMLGRLSRMYQLLTQVENYFDQSITAMNASKALDLTSEEWGQLEAAQYSLRELKENASTAFSVLRREVYGNKIDSEGNVIRNGAGRPIEYYLGDDPDYPDYSQKSYPKMMSLWGSYLDLTAITFSKVPFDQLGEQLIGYRLKNEVSGLDLSGGLLEDYVALTGASWENGDVMLTNHISHGDNTTSAMVGQALTLTLPTSTGALQYSRPVDVGSDTISANALSTWQSSVAAPSISAFESVLAEAAIDLAITADSAEYNSDYISAFTELANTYDTRLTQIQTALKDSVVLYAASDSAVYAQIKSQYDQGAALEELLNSYTSLTGTDLRANGNYTTGGFSDCYGRYTALLTTLTNLRTSLNGMSGPLTRSELETLFGYFVGNSNVIRENVTYTVSFGGDSAFEKALAFVNDPVLVICLNGQSGILNNVDTARESGKFGMYDVPSTIAVERKNQSISGTGHTVGQIELADCTATTSLQYAPTYEIYPFYYWTRQLSYEQQTDREFVYNTVNKYAYRYEDMAGMAYENVTFSTALLEAVKNQIIFQITGEYQVEGYTTSQLSEMAGSLSPSVDALKAYLKYFNELLKLTASGDGTTREQYEAFAAADSVNDKLIILGIGAGNPLYETYADVKSALEGLQSAADELQGLRPLNNEDTVAAGRVANALEALIPNAGVLVNGESIHSFASKLIDEEYLNAVSVVAIAVRSGPFAVVNGVCGNGDMYTKSLTASALSEDVTGIPTSITVAGGASIYSPGNDAWNGLAATPTDGDSTDANRTADYHLNESYCFCVDLLFMTSERGSVLQLQTTPTYRVSGENEEEDADSALMGGGSFIKSDYPALYGSLRFVFADTLTREVYATASADENGLLTLDGGGYITSLEPEQVAAITVWIYLDGNSVTSADVTNTELSSLKVNLQFSSNIDMNPAVNLLH